MYHATQQPQQYNNTVTTTTGYFSTTATGYSSASDTDTSYDDHHHTSTSHFISHHQYLPSSSQYASDSEHSEHSSRSFSSEDPNNYASRSSPSSADDPSPTDSSNLTDFPALFCRAKYDYTAQDASALSFVTGDIIEVLTQQPSGWWDGLLGEERGWFPSNYVIVISEEEAEREWEGREIMQAGDNQMQMQMTGGQGQSHRHTQSTSSVVDMGQALMGGSSSSTDEWLANTIAESRSMGIDDDQGLGGPSRGRGRGGAESDFWMPQVASNGQIFYINTKTGEQSRDLPQEAEDDIDLSMTDDAPLALAQSSSSSRAGPGVLGYATSSGPYTDLDPSSAPYASGSSNSQFQSQPGFGLPRRTDTPEPWIRRLADDGLSYYYLNQVDGRVQWTRPESLTSRGSGLPETPTTAVPLPLHGRARSDSVNNLTGGGHGVYSDSSDVDVSLADEVDDAKGKGKQRLRGHAHSGSITTIGTTGTTETAIASGSGHSHLTTSSGGTFTGTLANSNAHNLPLSSTHSPNFSQGPDPSHKQLTPDSSFLRHQPTSISESSDSQQALLLAAQLQSALYPPPPEDPLDMVHRARDAVERVIVRLNLGGLGILGETSPNQGTSTGSMGGGREENASAMADLDTLIEDVVASVRGLLYVCGAGPSTTGGSVGGSRENGVITAGGGGGGLEALVPKIMVGITPTVAFTSISASAASPSESSPLRLHTRTDSRSQSNPLKPSQRKLTATLSRLVLSARAIRYDSANASPESTIERIRGDAMELGRAIGAFGVEVQKVLAKLDRLNEDELYQRQISLNLTSNIDLAPMLLKLNLNSTLLSLGKKRLTAAFEPTNLGLGMPGSGRAGSWTGFGFVAEDDLDEYEDQDIESEVAERKKVNGNSKKANGVGGSNATDTDLSDFSEFSERESEGEGSEVSDFSEVDSGVDIEFGDSSNSDASSVVVRRSRPRRAPRGGRGKKRKRSPGHGSGVGVGSHSSNQAPEVNLQSNQNNPNSSHPTKSGNHSSSHLAKKKNMPTRPPMKPLSPDLVSDIAASVTRLDAFLGVLDIAVVQQQQHSPAERNNTNATDQQYEYIQRAQRIHQVQRFAKDVIGQVQTVLELVDDVDVAESVVLDTPIPHDTTLSQSVDGPLNSLAEEKKKVVISNSNGEGSKDEREGGRTALSSHHSSHSLSTVETTETVDTVDTRMSSVFTHGTGSSFNGFSSSSHTSHTSHSQNSTPILDDNSHSSFISKHSPSFARTQDVSFTPRTDLSQTLPTARALLRMLEAGVQALYDDAAALWGHVQVLRVEGSDYPYSHSSSSSSNINSSSEFLSSSSYHSSDGSFSNQTDPAMILSVVNVLSTAIKANAAVVLQILDKLLALGVEQRTIVEGVLEEEDSATSSVGVAGGDMMNTRGTNGVRRWEESVRWSKRVSRDVDRDVSKRMSHQRSSMVRVRPASILPASVGPDAQGGGGYGGGVPTALQPGYNMLRYGGYEGQTHEVYDEYGRGSSSLPVSQMVGGGVTAPGIVGSDGDDELGLEDAFLRPQRPIRLEPIRFQGPQSPDAYGVPASQIIQSGQGKLQASGSSASLSQLGQSTDYPSYSGQFGMGQQGIPPMPGSILRNASAPMVTTLTSLNQPQYQNQAQYNQAQYQTQYQNQAQVQYNQIPKVRTTGSVGAQNVQGFSERNQYGQYPSDFEPGYGAIGSSANASEGEDTLSGGFDDFDEDDEDEDDVLVRGSDDPLTPKIKGSSPPTPAKPNKISNKISSKAAKILGEEAPPWFLLPDEGKGPQETGLVVDPEDKSVKGGSVKALVERLTAHDTTDPNYSKAFLMTFKSFTTLNDLFDLLVERFRIQPPSGLATLQLRQWTSRKRNIVQFRVINTFKSMLTDEDILEKDDLYILARMKEFVLSEDVAQVSASRSLLALIERVQKSGETKRIVVKAAQTAPAPLLPKGFSSISSNLSSMANMGSSSAAKRLKLTDIEPLELARQLTLLESALYQKIRPMECLQRAREGVGAKDKDGGSGGGMDNIAYVIQTSNRIADWVAESVLSKEDSRKRAATVKHLILVADRCRTLNNFSTMIAIVSGLNTPPIRRLKRTWELVSQRHMAQFGACEVTLDSNRNFNKYRSMLASVVPPCVPFIGVFLSTLQFIQDGNKDLLSDGVVNFKKRQMASEVISDIKRWQAHTYNLQVVPAIRDYIEECLSAYDETDTRMSSDRFWQMSLEREPREREDEKMARLLQESGFL